MIDPQSTSVSSNPTPSRITAPMMLPRCTCHEILSHPSSQFISVPNSTASKPGGKLFDLPREIRDQIYRYVVKSTYVVREQREHGLPLSGLSGEWRYARLPRAVDHSQVVGHPHPVVSPGVVGPNPGLGILCVSKDVSDEAMAVLYAEGTFRITFSFRVGDAIWLSLTEAVERMMNIELEVSHWVSYGLPQGPGSKHLDSLQKVWNATLGCINRTDSIRKIFRIIYRLSLSDVDGAIPEWMYQGCKSMRRFRTVIVEVRPEVWMIAWGARPREPSRKKIALLKRVDQKVEDIKKYLQHALGPAVVNHLHDPGNTWHPRTLTFYPQEHIAAILRGQAEALRVEADRLDLEADRAEKRALE